MTKRKVISRIVAVMKLHEHASRQLNQIARYGAGEIRIADQVLTAPCIVAPGLLVTDWIVGPDSLDIESLQVLLPRAPRIVLVGSPLQGGARWQPLRRALASREIALEAMDLGAACRTYNVLAQEDRPVAALLFP